MNRINIIVKDPSNITSEDLNVIEKSGGKIVTLDLANSKCVELNNFWIECWREMRRFSQTDFLHQVENIENELMAEE